MSDVPSIDDYRAARGLPPGHPIDLDDHRAWLAAEVGGTEVVLHQGEVLEAAVELRVDVVTHWTVPFTGGAEGVLPSGTRVRVLDDPVPTAIGFGAIPLAADELEAALVPAVDRELPTYDSYSLSLLKRDVGSKLVRVDRGTGG